jgi:hypothetical protein
MDAEQDSERPTIDRHATLKMVHNLFFPMNWREASVSP